MGLSKSSYRTFCTSSFCVMLRRRRQKKFCHSFCIVGGLCESSTAVFCKQGYDCMIRKKHQDEVVNNYLRSSVRDLVTPNGENVRFVVCVSTIVHFKHKMSPFKCLDTCSYARSFCLCIAVCWYKHSIWFTVGRLKSILSSSPHVDCSCWVGGSDTRWFILP